MLERRVDEPMVGIRVFELVAPVEIAAIAIEEGREHEEEHVNVHGSDQREEQKRGRANKLVEPLVSNNGKGTRIVKLMMRLVMSPKRRKAVATPMPREFEEIACNPANDKGGEEVGPTIRLDATVCLALTMGGKPEGERRGQGRSSETFKHRPDLISNLGVKEKSKRIKEGKRRGEEKEEESEREEESRR